MSVNRIGRRHVNGAGIGAVSGQLADELQRLILSGAFSDSGRLPSERELGRRYAVSRTALREAMKLLSGRGLVYSDPGRGTFIEEANAGSLETSMKLAMKRSDATLGHLLAVRRVVEMETVALAAVNRTEADTVALYEAVREMDQGIRFVERYTEADQAFHRALAVASGNPMFVLLVDSLAEVVAESRQLMFFSRGAPQRGQKHHRAIADAVNAQDVATARQWMGIHLEEVAHASAEVDRTTRKVSRTHKVKEVT
jgi:GntR family transcriptional repressor for pyruvate dehydrogenase complex